MMLFRCCFFVLLALLVILPGLSASRADPLVRITVLHVGVLPAGIEAGIESVRAQAEVQIIDLRALDRIERELDRRFAGIGQDQLAQHISTLDAGMVSKLQSAWSEQLLALDAGIKSTTDLPAVLFISENKTTWLYRGNNLREGLKQWHKRP